MTCAAALIFGWLALVVAPAAPDGPTDPLPQVEHDEARARAAWEAGAVAFAAGDMHEAIKQFELTFRYSGRPGPMFSLGQAHRHLWEQTKDDRQRRLAVVRYQRYLELDAQGRRKLEAERWITELQDELEDLGEPPPLFTRLGITSPTPGATASIDGGPTAALPITPDVAPGRHVVEVSAAGFHGERREVALPEGSTLPLMVELVPIDAQLSVRGPVGAEVYVDGQRVGSLPLRAAVALAPGRHQLGVAQRGRTLFVRELELDRAERDQLEARLETTGQRKVALAAVVVGASASAAAVVLMALALDQQRRAREVHDELTTSDSGITLDRYRDGAQAAQRRDALRAGALATGITGLAVLATGVLLWITDRPAVGSQLQRPPAGGRGKSTRVQPTLAVSTSFAGAGVLGRF